MKRYLTYGHRFCAVEHAHNNSYQVLELTKKRRELVISKQENYTSQKAVFESLKNKKHLFLILNNEQILFKSIPLTAGISEDRLVKTAFPTIVLEDFYVEVLKNNTTSFIAICRKDVIDTLIQEYAAKGIFVIDFSLGNLAVKNVQSYLQESQISTSNACIILENNKIETIEIKTPIQEIYHINGLEIPSKYILVLAGVLSYYSNEIYTYSSAIKKRLTNVYKQHRFFALGLQSSLGFLFGLLLINYLVFINYQKKVSELQTEVLINESYKKQLTSLNDLVTKKKKIVESISSASNSRAIWYVNEISKTVPSSLYLDEIKYQPLEKPIKDEKPIVFKNDEITVKGISRNDEDLIAWKSSLEKQTWVEQISFMNYGKGKTRKTSFDFIIHIKKTK
jgi:Tfp pilus assembly protein PilN